MIDITEENNINTKDYWNTMYGVSFYQDDIKLDHSLWYEAIEHFLGERKDQLIIEVACGMANNANFAAALGNNVLATDISERAIIASRERFKDNKRLFFRVMDIDEVSRSLKGDVVFAFEILEHFNDPEIVLNKLAKCLRTDGKLIFSMPHDPGKNSKLPAHYSFWNYDSCTKRMFSAFREVRFYKNIGVGEQIFGCAIK